MTWADFLAKWSAPPTLKERWRFDYDDLPDDCIPLAPDDPTRFVQNQWKGWFVEGWRDERAEMCHDYPRLTSMDALVDGCRVFYMAKGGKRGMATWAGGHLRPDACGPGSYWLDASMMAHYLRWQVVTFWSEQGAAFPEADSRRR